MEEKALYRTGKEENVGVDVISAGQELIEAANNVAEKLGFRLETISISGTSISTGMEVAIDIFRPKE